MLTYREFQQGPAKRIAAVVPSGDEFRDLTNDAVRELMRRGNFWGTVQPMRGCIYGSCVTWPRQVGTVLAINSCNRPIPLKNFWYSYVPWDESHYQCAANHIRNGWTGNIVAVNDGTSPVFNPIACNTDMYLQFYPSVPTDVNKKITIYGIDTDGQVIRGQRADKTWQDGVELLLSLPYVQTPFKIRRVDRVVKSVTNGVVRGYQWDGISTRDGVNPLLYNLAQYDASETTPEYMHSRISGVGCNCACDGTQQISALVKLAYVPIEHEDDLVLIDNTDALRDMIMSIREKEGGNIEKSQALELSAFRELNYQLRDKFPIEQFVSDFRPYGSARLQRRKIGSLI